MQLLNSKNKHVRKKRRAVITGIGIVSPIGIGKNIFWQNLLDGKTGVDRISLFDASSFPSQIAAEVKGFDGEKLLGKRRCKYFSRPTQFACVAFEEAKQDAGFTEFDPFRTDVILGTATSEFGEFDRQVFRSSSAGRIFSEGAFEPQVMARIFINAPACAISLSERIQGLVTTISTACTSSLNAIGLAVQRIEDGRADVVVTGGADCGISHFSLNSFCAADALSTMNDSPDEALCPFDERHTKSVLGEGSAIFILEDVEHALANGRRIYCEVSGYYQENENMNELYMLDRSGDGWTGVIKSVVHNAKAKVDMVCAHGPSDQAIDRVECLAIRAALGNRAEKIPVTSIKGATGSPLGVAGGLQLATAALSIRHGIIPPTYNFQVADPECKLRVVDQPLSNPRIEEALINAHGFGGVNAAATVRAVR